MHAEAGEDWAQVTLMVRAERVKEVKVSGEMEWLTRQDLLQHYHNDVKFVDQLITRKHKQGHSRPHPENPTNKDHVQHWCLKRATAKVSDISRVGFTTELEMQGEAQDVFGEDGWARCAPTVGGLSAGSAFSVLDDQV